MPLPTGVSVVIPTICRPSLEGAIAAVVRAAAHVEEPVEVIVVDDRRSGEATFRPDNATDGIQIRWLRTREAGVEGVSAARNLGLESAAYDVVAFTDDDGRCDEQWLRAALAELRRDPLLAGVEAGVRLDPGPPLDAVRSRLVLNLSGGGFLSASLFARTEAARAIGGFRRIAADRSGRQFPFREDTDFGIRLVRAAGPVPFVPESFILHPPEAVGIGRLIRLARMFIADAVLARLHPAEIPALIRRPLARLRIRAASAVTLLAPVLVFRRARVPVTITIVILSAGVSSQFEVELRAAGVRRPLLRSVLDTIRRLPRSLVWSLVAGSARFQGEIMVRMGLITLGDASLRAEHAEPERPLDCADA